MRYKTENFIIGVTVWCAALCGGIAGFILIINAIAENLP